MTLRGTLVALCIALSSCGSPEAPKADCTGGDVLVAASDYSSSVVGAVDLAGNEFFRGGIDLGRDPALARSRGRSFFLARDGDLLVELDGCANVIATTSTRDIDRALGTNPQDVAVAPDGRLWIARFNVPTLAVIDPRGGRSVVDLSSLDSDGNPNASSVRIVDVGGAAKAFVALERLDDRDRLRSKQPSRLARIDVATQKLEATVELAAQNPFGLMTEWGGYFFLAAPRDFDVANEDAAGIERFTVGTGATRILVSERDLGASVVQVAVTTGCGAAIVADPVPTLNPTSLVTFDPESGALFSSRASPVLGPTAGYHLQGLTWVGSVLLVGDRRRGARGFPVHVFDRDAGCGLRERAEPLYVPREPVALVATH